MAQGRLRIIAAWSSSRDLLKNVLTNDESCLTSSALANNMNTNNRGVTEEILHVAGENENNNSLV